MKLIIPLCLLLCACTREPNAEFVGECVAVCHGRVQAIRRDACECTTRESELAKRMQFENERRKQ